ncbi:MAG: Flp pilus assembly complex ATPase component TadA [Rhodocyclales bacterium]|nr:Flp pilus assembly complex ATPase component TadA [Rhodocyclales bacterium]
MTDYARLFSADAAPDDGLADQPAQRYRVLIVDDEENVRRALKRVFRRENYDILTAADGAEALALLAQQQVALIISDYMMPGMSGGELLKQARALQPDSIRFMLTGHADMDAVLSAVKSGAVYKFMLKPWNDDDLRLSVALALEQYELKKKNRALADANDEQKKAVDKLANLAINNRSQLIIMLGKQGLLNPQQVQELFRLQQGRKEPVIRLLLEKDWVAEDRIRAMLANELLIEQVSLAEYDVDPAVAGLLPQSLCRRQCVVPLRVEQRRLTLAMADPVDHGVLDDLRFLTGLDLQPVSASVADIMAKLDALYGIKSTLEDLATVVGPDDPYEGIQIVIDDEDEDASLDDLLSSTEEPPAIRLANAIILEAIRLGASDIHIHPRTKSVVVRYRIDGILIDKIQVPPTLLPSLVSRLKIMAELDISERRRPQDGRITVKTALHVVDLRMSTLPTINGEKVVMRLLERNAPVQQMEKLGFHSEDLERVRRMVRKPQGIILATGPTGSGKTTTLYSLLQGNLDATRNYVTLEDPVEYYLDPAGQVLIRDKIGLTFASVLRAVLRQDPDVILLGEIRDLETAEVAFHAALTGHQVFSTLHTNSAIATISRLFDLGLKPFVVATALEGIIAQRLARRICPDCRTEAAPDPALLQQLGADPKSFGAIFKGRGCVHCHGTGYRGRIGLYEVLLPDDNLRQLITDSASILEIKQHARNLGTRSLLDDGLDKIRLGQTTPEEVLRILGPQ